MRVLITGITGFSGNHLAEYCINKGYEVFGTIRSRVSNPHHLKSMMDDLVLLDCDLGDLNSVINTINDCEPELIFHLGAQSFVPISWRLPKMTMDTNVLGTLNILEAVRKSHTDPKIMITGSSEEYGLVHPEETPIKETNPLRPLSPYGVSKVATDLLGYQYHQSYGLKAIRIRPFNIMGPRSGKKIVTAAFAIQLVKMEKGARRRMKVGNLDSIRDLNDARDVARAYDLALQKCDYGDVYNICSGDGITIKELLTRLIDIAHISGEIDVKVDEEKIRPSDVVNLLGDSTKFRNKTGWKPEIELNKSLGDILQYWRDSL